MPVIDQRLMAGALSMRRGRPDDLARLVAVQRAAYAVNRVLLGLEPIPLLADYAAVLVEKEVWLGEDGGRLIAALVLESRAEDLLIESIAIDPHVQARGIGGGLLAAAEWRARELGHSTIRLYTGATLRRLIAWYERSGFALERVEALTDRKIAHMVKRI